MRNFFKIFFASILALTVFTVIIFIFVIRFAKNVATKDKPVVEQNTVLVLDLGQHFQEQVQDNPLSFLSNDAERNVPGLYDLIRMLRYAREDKNVEGLLILAKPGSNGFSAGTEIRKALLEFKASGKFIIAHSDIITQKTYSIINVADRIYVSPQGYFEWFGYSVDYAFVKGTLEKLDIETQVFYAGKFKSATEPLRSDRMSEENKLQTGIWLGDLYDDLLAKTALARKLDTALLRTLAVEGRIRTPNDALTYKLVDGVKYDDEVKDEIKAKLGYEKYDRIGFMTVNTYMNAAKYIPTGSEKIALIYAEGDIVDGQGGKGIIGSEDYRNLIRKARLDRNIKAIVFRINSGGGSSMASENIWRELSLAKKDKPVIVSFGDVAASGAYYIACAGDSIFAQPTTITGSIGVFGIVPNLQEFFRNKLGVTFDGIKTGPYADAMSITRPMTDKEKTIIQAEIDSIYALFKKRVADGRKKDILYIDSIAQGRVWTGTRAINIGLIDRFGGIDEAIQSAASMAKLTDYEVKEFPEPENFIEQIFGKSTPIAYAEMIKHELGDEEFRIYQQMKKVKQMTNTIQARLPFEYFIK